MGKLRVHDIKEHYFEVNITEMQKVQVFDFGGSSLVVGCNLHLSEDKDC